MAIGSSTDFHGNVKPSAVENAVYDPTVSANRYVEIPSNMQMFLDYGARSDGQPDYIGYAPRGLAAGTNGWLLQKFTYSADPGSMTSRQIGYGNWTNRATATYA